MKIRWPGIQAIIERYSFSLIFAILALGIIAGGVAYFRHYAQRYRTEVEHQLSAVAELKAAEIGKWREGQLAIANVFHNNSAFSALVRRFFDNPEDAAAQNQIQEWIGNFQIAHKYLCVFLTDTQGVIRISAPDALPLDVPHLARDAGKCLGSGQIVFLDLHRDVPDGPVHLAVMVPIFDNQDGRRPLGMLALRVDPATYLYPFLNRWPIQSPSSETLLIRREGNEAVLLNELKFRTNAPLNLRFPLTQTELPAVSAVLSQEGIVTGTDYRGVPVIADVRRVPNTPWFMVAKMDVEEVYAPLRMGQWLVVVIMLILLFSAGVVVALIWQQTTKAQYRDLLDAEKAHHESEAHFQSMIETSPLAIHLTMGLEQITEYVNPMFVKLFGYTRQDIPSVAQWWHLAFPDETYRRKISEELTSRITQAIDAQTNMEAMEVVVACKDGSKKNTLWGCVNIGDKNCFYGLDIDERKRAEEQVRALLAESDKAQLALLGILEDQSRTESDLKRLAAAIEQAVEIFVITDAQGLIQYVNPAFEKVTGYTRAEAIGRNPRFLKSGKQDEAFYRKLWSTIGEGKTWHGRFVNRKKNETLYTEDATISPVRDASGRIVNYVSVKRDITEELNVQAQLTQAQKMESVGLLAGGVAHDFNNMLQIILGNVSLLMSKITSDNPLRPELEEIKNAGLRAAGLTRQLLAFARKQSIAPRTIGLNETVESMLKMLRRLIGENVKLVWSPFEKLWPLKMDPIQIDQILANLCANAHNAIDGVGEVHIATKNVVVDEYNAARHEGFMPGDYVLLTVSDTGRGMDKETQAHVFEPFFTTSARGKGTGLGLATVYGIVRQNRGYIGVYSEKGNGTTFHIYLPRFTGSDAVPVTQDAVQPVSRGCETILLVEDEPAILRMTTTMLEKQGYTVLAANTPGEAIRLAKAYPAEIQLLLTDVVMPEMNGRDLALNLQVSHPRLKCLFMSGYTADLIARHGVLDEGVHFIKKPFSMADLSSKLRETLAGTPAPPES